MLKGLGSRGGAELAVDRPGVAVDGVVRQVQLAADVALRKRTRERAEDGCPGSRVRRTRRAKVAGAYMARLQEAAAETPALARAFVRVTGLVDPPKALLRPTVAFRVLRPRRRSAPASSSRSSPASYPARRTIGGRDD